MHIVHKITVVIFITTFIKRMECQVYTFLPEGRIAERMPWLVYKIGLRVLNKFNLAVKRLLVEMFV
jgi:hypothetical protein